MPGSAVSAVFSGIQRYQRFRDGAGGGADLDVEELGSICESLLDSTPGVTTEAEAGDGASRSLSPSREVPPHTLFLVPRGSLVRELIKRALLPAARERLEEGELCKSVEGVMAEAVSARMAVARRMVGVEHSPASEEEVVGVEEVRGGEALPGVRGERECVRIRRGTKEMDGPAASFSDLCSLLCSMVVYACVWRTLELVRGIATCLIVVEPHA